MPAGNRGALARARKEKLAGASEILRKLGFSARQSNKVAARTFLALLDLKPFQPWSEASAPLRGIAQIIEFIRIEYGLGYAPNTRESIRDDAVKYFVEYGIVVRNPDAPGRPTTSGKTVYQIEPHAMALFRGFGSSDWGANSVFYLSGVGKIRQELDRGRSYVRVPVKLPSGEIVELSPGGQNPLIKTIVEEFCHRFVSDPTVAYIGDTQDKFLHLEREYLKELKVEIPPPAKMPDLVIHDRRKNWLLLIEAVTSAGPVDGKRRKELKEILGLRFRPCLRNCLRYQKLNAPFPQPNFLGD